MIQRNNLAFKVCIALAMALCFTIGFSWINHHNHLRAATSGFFWNPGTAWDVRIPFIPHTVWIYFLYYPLCFTAIWLVRETPDFYGVAASLSLEFILSFIVFYFFPARMERPSISDPGLTGAAIRLLYSVDPGYNIFPSLHVANLVLISILFIHFRRYRTGVAMTLAAVAVSLSTLTVKQHYLLDILSGIGLAVMSYYIVFVQRYGGRVLFSKAPNQLKR